jgi:vancomycin aglycone glucosyltransferase
MRVLLSVVGTRGDVQPVLALALCVREYGHDVHLCIPPNFIAWAGELGFTATSVGIEMRAPRPSGPTVKPIPDLIADQFESLLGATRQCDIILGANAHQYAAPSVAELRGVPYVNVLYAPTALPAEDNVRSWNERALDRVNANRARLGLAALGDVLRHIVTDHPWLATDPVLAPTSEATGMRVVQTGAWMFDDTRPLPRDLEEFLTAADPPVYVGFGSMPVAEGTSRILIEAARAAGRRVILSRGWGGLTLAGTAPDCIEIDDVNHRALFGRVAIVVHHGGAGTTHAAARAGVPQVIVPMFGDQPFWAGRVRALGIGASILPTELSAERLAAALNDVTRQPTTERAKALAPRITTDGPSVAARLLTDLVA